jgi:hypothetical protein
MQRFGLVLVLVTTFALYVASVSRGAEDYADAIDEVNAARAARGLPAFVRDDGLSEGALHVARFRAARLIAGHTGNDFAGLPKGVIASAAGCAAWYPSLGWGSCCTYENYTYAGAAWAMGGDGRRYCQLFVR